MEKNKMNGNTKLVGILGWPVEHSFSPRMQNAAIQDAGINAVYVPLPCAPENLEQAVAGLRATGFLGANVTIPHKETVGQYLDEISEEAAFTGSVNTIYRKGNQLYGTSTDAFGAMENLREHGVSIQDKHVVLIGAGGAARALSWPLATGHQGNIPASFSIAARKEDLEAAHKIAKELSQNTACKVAPKVVPLEYFSENSKKWDLIIHATPIGMHPHTENSVLDTSSFSHHPIVFDIVYNPPQTKLLQIASENGCQTVEGLGMLLHQGVESFRKWFNSEPNVKIMKKALLQAK